MNSGCIGTYDAAGNMTEGPDGNDPTVKRKYIYDAWNRLAKVTDGETVIAKFEYDAVGRRILKIYDSQSLGTPDGVDACEHYLHSGDQVIETRQADLVAGVAPDADAVNPTYQNVWSLRYIDALILRDENTDAATDDQCDNGRIFYLADANFNVTAIVAESSHGEEDWAVRERYIYAPYGAATILDADFFPVPGNTSAYATTTLYTGRRLDAETGLYYYRARYYHARLGRFVSRDPIGYAAGDANLHRYVKNRAVTALDPVGLDLQQPTETDRLGVGRLIHATTNEALQNNESPIFFLGFGSDKMEDDYRRILEGVGRQMNENTHFTYDNLDDLIRELNDRLKRVAGNAKNGCIGILELQGHARGTSGGTGMQLGTTPPSEVPEDPPSSRLPYGIYSRYPYVAKRSGDTNYLDYTNAEYVGNRLKNETTLCECCMIILKGCNVGCYARAYNAAYWLAKSTGCTLAAAGGFVMPSGMISKEFQGKFDLNEYFEDISEIQPENRGTISRNSRDDTWYIWGDE